MKCAQMAQRFNVAGRLVTVNPLGSGNINETFLAIFRTAFSEERFILQRINQNVFSEPVKVMENIHRVTEFIHRKLEEEQDLADRIWQMPRIIEAKDGLNYAIDNDGDYWRAITVISSASSYDSVQSLEHALEVGSVLGQFHRLFSNLPVENMSDTLPGFHITPKYMEGFDAVVNTPAAQEKISASNRAKNILRFIESHRDWCHLLEDAKNRGELMMRPIHGDPKINNIMIDDITGKGTSLIDLDTIKPGLVQYDIGDCLRSCCNPAGEEAKDLSKVYFDTDICEAVLRGYRRYAQHYMTEADKFYVYDSIKMITFELCLRFYSDFLAGDVYFKTSYDGHNLHRANVQMQLFNSIETRESIIRRTAEKL